MALPAAALEREQRAFLGVERSASGRCWRSRLDVRGEAIATAIAQRNNIPELLARVLAARGVEPENVAAYLDPTIRSLLPDPYTLTGMPEAAARIADAIMRGEQIAIFGDYDVDGATSAALLCRYLRHCGLDPIVHIPDRLFEGYGPNVDAVRALAGRGAKLLVTVDCGTTSPDALAEAALLGMDTVVIDHHQADEQLPPAIAVVNPNRVDDLSGLGHLAAVGLVFVTVVAVNRELRKRGYWTADRPEPDLLSRLDLVALGTIADVVPLKGLNRAFVAKGLIALRWRENAGTTALMDVARLSGPPEAWHLAFLLGPRINAGGRIGQADLGVKLLLEEDATEAGRIAEELNRLNVQRQAIERDCVLQAEAEAEASLGKDDNVPVVVTAAEGWHPGVVGLIAARLKERYGRPAFAIALGAGGVGTGSGRSIPGADLGHVVRQAVADGLLLKGGGHAMAAGVTLHKDRLAAIPRLPGGRIARGGHRGAARRCALDRWGRQRRRRYGRPLQSARPRRALRFRQSRADPCAAQSHHRVRRSGRRKPRAGAAACPRWRFRQRDCVSCRRQAARPGSARKPRPGGARGRMPRR